MPRRETDCPSVSVLLGKFNRRNLLLNELVSSPLLLELEFFSLPLAGKGSRMK